MIDNDVGDSDVDDDDDVGGGSYDNGNKVCYDFHTDVWYVPIPSVRRRQSR